MLTRLRIRRKLMAMLMLTSGTVLLVTCVAFIIYESISFRQQMLRNVATISRVIANNSTAALAFENQDDAREVLMALRAEPQVMVAALYDERGALFATYPANTNAASLPQSALRDGYHFESLWWRGQLIGDEPVVTAEGHRYGTLYIRASIDALYRQLGLYSLIALLMTAVALVLAYLISRHLQRQISTPVLQLADLARQVEQHNDFSLRAHKLTDDELGTLTDSFNQMLGRIQQHERTIRDSEARVRAVLDSALSAVVVINAEDRIVDWNARAADMFGWPRNEVLGAQMVELLVPPVHRAAHRRGMEHYRATGEGPILGKLIEMTAMRRDGTEIPVELSISALRDGATLGFCGFITDITERKQSQARLQAQLGRLDLLHRITRAIGERQDLHSIFQVVTRSLEDNLPLDFCCICLYDADARALTVTHVGVRSREFALQLAMPENATIPIDENGLSRCVRGHLVYEEDVTKMPYPFPRRLAAAGLHAMVAAPLRAESEVFGVLITASRKSHNFSSNDCEFLDQLSTHVALAAHQMRLHLAVQEAYDELRQSQQIVLQQERLRALGQMASGVAHDINNAISPVSLYTESLLNFEPGLSERARNYLTTIQRAVEDVAKTVSRMREFYRPREEELSFSHVDLNQTAQQVIELTQVRWRDLPQQSGAVVDLRTDFATQLPQIMGAVHEIRDALTNLIFNAVDAMPDGGKLTVRTRVQPMQGIMHVVLEVQDTGIGMDEQTRLRCLEPFFTTKGERGTGLGLAMVYGMVQRHGGELQIDSAFGVGTTIRLLFAAAPTTQNPMQAQTATQHPRHSRLLIVDDDPLIIESLQEILRREGHDVTAADGGQAGIDCFTAAHAAGRPFDLVITDLGMPYVDGRRVAAAIKQMSSRTPVMMLTGWGQRLQAENDVPPYVDLVLNKPPKLAELRRALLDLLSDDQTSKSS